MTLTNLAEQFVCVFDDYEIPTLMEFFKIPQPKIKMLFCHSKWKTLISSSIKHFREEFLLKDFEKDFDGTNLFVAFFVTNVELLELLRKYAIHFSNCQVSIFTNKLSNLLKLLTNFPFINHIECNDFVSGNTTFEEVPQAIKVMKRSYAEIAQSNQEVKFPKEQSVVVHWKGCVRTIFI
ncbi:hypothetical protein SNEBB_000882 [Seison nebaliae]|nr:hypothetical protein SNEBB_000882 [Seison nebaliae]